MVMARAAMIQVMEEFLGMETHTSHYDFLEKLNLKPIKSKSTEKRTMTKSGWRS